MRSWQSGAAISPTIRTGSSPPPSSTGGQLSSKTLPVEVFIRRWYKLVKRDHEAISSILRRYLKHASSMLKLPASMAAKTMVFLLATQRTVLEGGRVTSAQCKFPVETATFFSACLDTMLLLDLERDDGPRVPPETFTTVNS